MIIDCHGHYTTAPAAHTAWREQQVAAWEAGTTPPAYPSISDDEIRETIESSQLRLMDERGIDVTLFSPRASAMAPHVGDAAVSLEWSRRCNDLVHRVATLYPGRFVPVGPAAAVPRCRPAGVDRRAAPVRGGARLRRLQPQPRPQRRLLDVAAADRPQLVPVLRGDGRAGRAGDGARLRVGHPGVPRDRARTTSTPTRRPSCSSSRATSSATCRTCDWSSRTAGERCPTTGAGTGGWPTCWSSRRSSRTSWANVFFDTCVYHQPGIDLLLDVIDTPNILFGSEMVGAVRGIDERTGHHYDDTRRYIEASRAWTTRPAPPCSSTTSGASTPGSAAALGG